MSRAFNKPTESDVLLMKFGSYEDYLDSMVDPRDYHLRSQRTARKLAEIGYRNAGRTLSKVEFENRLQILMKNLNASHFGYIKDSEGIAMTGQVEMALSERETYNRLGVLATIIYIRYISKRGHEVSGYIDYAERLETEDWVPYFKGEKLITPRTTDLGYYIWRSDKKVFTNNSSHYITRISKTQGLIFQHRYDRLTICVRPHTEPGHNTTRHRIATREYLQVVFFDHLVRRN